MQQWERTARKQATRPRMDHGTCLIDEAFVSSCLNGERSGRIKIEHMDDYWQVTAVNKTFEYWLLGANFHRIGGPAFIQTYNNDVVLWRIQGKEITSWHQYQQMAHCSNEELIILKLKWGQIRNNY